MDGWFPTGDIYFSSSIANPKPLCKRFETNLSSMNSSANSEQKVLLDSLGEQPLAQIREMTPMLPCIEYS